MNHRREIDGLRALAVVPVILFHAGFTAFGGGFVGVDVFFVISGYLITSIILAEKEAGTFTLAGFYERRARRILPALFVVMLTCLPFAWLWLLPGDLKDFSRSLIGVTTFVSNVLFWRESGYFVTAAELKPLLHTWSLAVEEQYYLLFPPFILLAWRLGKAWIMCLLSMVLLISLVGAHWGSINKPIANFFLLPTRGWELMIGALIAFYHAAKPESYRPGNHRSFLFEAGGIAGALLIVYAILSFDKTTPFPSLYALVPTMGAALIIFYANESNIAGKILGSKVFVSIGLISYSAYLWHQPLFALARQRSINDLSKGALLALVAASLILAFFSLKFVETPFRNKERIGTGTVATLAIAFSAIFLAAGYWGYSTDGLPDRFPARLSEFVFPEKTNEGAVCHPKPVEGVEKLQLCYFGDQKASKSVALYGDSHSQALFSALDMEFQKNSIRGVRVYLDGCGVIPGVILDNNLQRTGGPLRECLAGYESMLRYFRRSVDGVIIGVRWTMQVYPVVGEIDQLPFDNGEGGVEFIEPRKYITLDAAGSPSYDGAGKRAAIEYMLKSMNSLGMQVFVVGPVPEVGWDVPKFNFGTYLKTGDFPRTISTSYERFKLRNRFVNEALAGVPVLRNIEFVKPETILCGTYLKDRCVAQWDGTPLYFDDDHLSNAGAALVTREIMRRSYFQHVLNKGP